MNRLVTSLLTVALIAPGAWFVAAFLTDAVVTEIYCDGALPVWMLTAQDYDGGGCAEVLPTSAAPPNADWRLYCLGLCAIYPTNEEYRFGP